MSIIAKSNGTNEREVIPEGMYLARCYRMIHIGTIPDNFQGKAKTTNKVRIGWELPTELRQFGEKGWLPLVIDQTYTLSLGEKANLRKMLKSWRGRDFTEEEAENFDVAKLLGVQCMLNITHRVGKDSKTYAEISAVTPVPKGTDVPTQINPTFELNYGDSWSEEKFKSLPDFIKAQMVLSDEYRNLKHPTEVTSNESNANDDLPF